MAFIYKGTLSGGGTLAGPFDVVHAAHPLLIPATSAAQIVTIHDLFFLSAPGSTSREIARDYPSLAGFHARRAHAVLFKIQNEAVEFTFGIHRIRKLLALPFLENEDLAHDRLRETVDRDDAIAHRSDAAHVSTFVRGFISLYLLDDLFYD